MSGTPFSAASGTGNSTASAGDGRLRGPAGASRAAYAGRSGATCWSKVDGDGTPPGTRSDVDLNGRGGFSVSGSSRGSASSAERPGVPGPRSGWPGTGRGLRHVSQEHLELSAPRAGEERIPPVPGEPQDGPGRVPAVADADRAAR